MRSTISARPSTGSTKYSGISVERRRETSSRYGAGLDGLNRIPTPATFLSEGMMRPVSAGMSKSAALFVGG